MTTWVMPSEITSDFSMVLLMASLLSITVLLVTLYIDEIEGCAFRLVKRLRASAHKPDKKGAENG